MAKKEDFVPADLVKRLYGEGKTETEIIRQLRTQGFTPSQIDKALKAVPKPHVSKGAYHGQLPAELVRPTAKAGAPEMRMPAPLLPIPLSLPSEQVSIPEELKPIDMAAPPRGTPHAAHEHDKKEHKEEHHLPAPVSIASSTGGAKISLEELVEQVAREQEKKIRLDLSKLESEHNSNVRKLSDMTTKLDALSASVKAMEKALEDKSAFSADQSRTLSSKVSALETAFKELAHYFHKK